MVGLTQNILKLNINGQNIRSKSQKLSDNKKQELNIYKEHILNMKVQTG